MDEDALLCELLPGQTVPVPLANSTYFQAVYVKLAVASGSTMADIRDFFPQGSCRDCDAGTPARPYAACLAPSATPGLAHLIRGSASSMRY